MKNPKRFSQWTVLFVKGVHFPMQYFAWNFRKLFLLKRSEHFPKNLNISWKNEFRGNAKFCKLFAKKNKARSFTKNQKFKNKINIEEMRNFARFSRKTKWRCSWKFFLKTVSTIQLSFYGGLFCETAPNNSTILVHDFCCESAEFRGLRKISKNLFQNHFCFTISFIAWKWSKMYKKNNKKISAKFEFIFSDTLFIPFPVDRKWLNITCNFCLSLFFLCFMRFW